MMMVRCYVAKSRIEGLGVFTDEDIVAGQLVWQFSEMFDILVSNAALAEAPGHVREFYERYAYEVTSFPGHMALDGDDGRFMNHEDTPNLDFSTPGRAVAARDIARGEELTCDYNFLATSEFEMQPPKNKV